MDSHTVRAADEFADVRGASGSPPPGPRCGSFRRRHRGTPVRARAVAPLLAAAFVLLPGCARHDCISTVEGCVGPFTYKHMAASVAASLGSSPEFEDRWALDAVNVADAWSHLQAVHGDERPGRGVTVGVLDTGIDLDHPTFTEGAAAGEVTEELLQGAEDETGVELSHGTGVAGVIAGRVNHRHTYPYTGIAPYASLRMFAIPLGRPPPPDTPFKPILLSDMAMYDEEEAALYREVLSHDLDILNLSFGVTGLVENYDDVPAVRAAMGHQIEALAQPDRDDPTILVWAAGNAHERLCRPGTANCAGDGETDYLGRPAGILDASSPSLLSGLMAHAEELRGHSIAVVAIGEPPVTEEGRETMPSGEDGETVTGAGDGPVTTGEVGEIAFFSNRCGIAADWCIAAPGLGVLGAYFGPYQGEVVRGYASLSGTSFAAPVVTGGIALMKQMFRDQLRNEELVTRLFRTADKSGPYGERAIYGQGLMDLDAALSPVGEPQFARKKTVTGDGTPVRQSRLSLGRAFGGGSAGGFSGHEIAGFDALGAPFWFDLGDFVLSPAPPSADARLRDFMAAPSIDRPEAEPDADVAPVPLQVGIRQTPGDTGTGHARLAPNALTLTFARPGGLVTTAFTTEGDEDRDARPASGALVSWRSANAPLGLRAGWLGERHSMLSATAEGAFGDLAADSLFIGLDLHHRAGGWRIGGGPELGLARPRAQGGIIAGVEPLATSAFALHASRPTAASGMLQVSLVQPLRVEDGDAVLSVPVGRTPQREVVRRRLAAGLTPAGRQLDLSVRWERPLADGELRLGAVATRHAGHDAEARPQLSVLAGWRTSF